jgi:hypothetical protein
MLVLVQVVMAGQLSQMVLATGRSSNTLAKVNVSVLH